MAAPIAKPHSLDVWWIMEKHASTVLMDSEGSMVFASKVLNTVLSMTLRTSVLVVKMSIL
jgi:hypothetical protein